MSSGGKPARGKPARERDYQAMVRMLATERLAVDEPGSGRTCFLTHLGAQRRLVPGAWIAHRDLLHALALANLSPSQRASLAAAVLVEHGREFGVGRLRLRALASGLPLGGSSLWIQPRTKGPRVLHAWALGEQARGAPADWMALRVQPAWALDAPPPTLQPASLATLAALGGDVAVLVEGAVAARLVANACAGVVDLAAHPRFAPHLDGLVADAPVVLWPHDALAGAGLRRRKLMAVVLVDAPEAQVQATQRWLGARSSRAELVAVTAPGGAGRAAVERLWRASERPAVWLRGDPAWAHGAEAWLRDLGAHVRVQGEPTQLGLL